MEQRDTPCVGICSTLYDAVCKGCGRTQEEVQQWIFFTDEEKNQVWDRLEAEGKANRFDKPGRK